MHLAAITLALAGFLMLFLDVSEAAPAAQKQAAVSWDVTIETGRKGQKEATLSFPDLPLTVPVTLHGSSVSVQIQSEKAPSLVSLRFPDGAVARGFLLQSGNELKGTLAKAEKPTPPNRQHWRAHSDRKHDWNSPLANAPLELKTGPATDMNYRRFLPTVRLESHEGDHEH